MSTPSRSGRSGAGVALPIALAAALVLSAALLLLGVVVESTTTSAAAAPASGVSSPAGHSEVGGEAAGHSEAGAEAGPATAAVTDPANGREASVLGIAVDSPVPVGAFVVVSLGLAALVWRRPTRGVTVVVIVVAGAALVLDVAEIVHQLGSGRTGPAVLAVLVGALHVSVIAGAGRLWRTAGSAGSGGDRATHAGTG